METTEQNCSLSEAVYVGLVNLSADATICIDEQQRIKLFNPGAEAIFGYRMEEVLGERLEVLLPEEIHRMHRRVVEEFSRAPIAARRMGEPGAVYGRRKCGEVFPADASISKMRVDGEWLFAVVLRDITEQRRVEDELKRMNEELQRSNADLERFATVASHDLQEPLRKIQAFGDHVVSNYAALLPERGQDYLGRMQDAAGRMSTLIQALLVFSRVTTTARPFEPVDLNEVLAEVLCDLEVRIEQSGGQVQAQTLPTIDADGFQMRQLFQNLLGNALKFHREGVPPKVMVTWSRKRQPSDHLLAEPEPDLCELIVRDNGVGFDEKYLDRIFEVFQRLHGRGVYGGTGMGLAICRKIAERHGGTIDATSSPGRGSEFSVTLPFSQSTISA